MTDQEIRAAILETAYKAAREHGILASLISVGELNKKWEEEKTKISFNADYLDGKGWVIWLDRKTWGGVMRITCAGVEEYERTHEDS